MYKKLIFVVSFVLVVSQACNAVEVARWDFEETSGTTATDQSGLYVATLEGSDTLDVDGRFGSGIDFAGDGGATVDAASSEAFRLTGDFSIVLWVNSDVAWGDYTRFVDISAADGGLQDSYRLFTGSGDNADNFRFMSRQDGSNTQNIHTRDMAVGTWILLVLRHDLDGDVTMNVLQDSDSVDESFVAANSESWPTLGPIVYAEGELKIGRMIGDTRKLDGKMDAVAFYDEVLTDAQVAAMFYTAGSSEYPLASGPKPADGAMLEATWANLDWRAGDFAVSHDVYIGGNFNDVNDGAEGTFVGNQAVTTLIVGFPGYHYPDGLVPGTTYYWRIDEVNDTEPNSPWKGNVWSFTVPPRTAYDPNPAHGAKFIDPNVELNWTGGFNAKLHYVYFGDNFNDVNNAVVGLPQSETTYTPGTLELEKVYYWRIDEFDGAATYKGNVWSFTVTKAGGGIKAEYFNNTTLSGEPVLTRLDPEIDFDWGNAEVAGENSPDASINVNNFSARWSGDLEVDLTDTYTFHINANNGFRMWLDGRPIIDYWDNTTTSSRESDPIELAGGNTYSIRMEYFEGEDVAIAQLFWESSTREQQIIPSGALQPPLKAGGADPYNGATDVRQTIILSWRQGDNAASHQVYFGTDEEAVRNADTASPEYKGTKALGSESHDPGKVLWDTTYYWRVDEVEADGTIQKGNVWSFTTANFILVDDFEDYNDYPPDEIFNTWIDGYGTTTNGSTAGYPDPDFLAGEHYIETSVAHGGAQSMPLFYENNFKYSEATMTLTQSNWTEEDVGVLSLWFRGNSDNAAERMYVALNGSATVYHDDPSAALIDEWTQWPIDLQEFVAQGVNLANVNTISIGFGDKNNLQAGGSGVVFFDDIRLYRPAPPEPEPLPPEPAP